MFFFFFFFVKRERNLIHLLGAVSHFMPLCPILSFSYPHQTFKLWQREACRLWMEQETVCQNGWLPVGHDLAVLDGCVSQFCWLTGRFRLWQTEEWKLFLVLCGFFCGLFTSTQRNGLFTFLIGVRVSWTGGAFGREKGITVSASSSHLTGCSFSFHFNYGCWSQLCMINS